RGAIGGMYAGRLGTALHIGTIKPTIRGNTRESSTLLSSIATLTLLSGLVLSAVTSLFLYLFAGATPQEVLLSVLIIIATMATSVLMISPITFLISVYSFRKGLDPDVVVYPIVSTVADVIITVFYIVMIKGALANYLMIAIADLFYVSIVVVVVLRNYKDAEYLRTIREFMITLMFVSIIVNITGLALEGFTKRIGIPREVFAVYPAVIDTVGDVGAIVGSTATTKIILGLMAPSLRGARAHSAQILNTWAASLILFIAYSFVSSLLFGFEHLGRLLLQLVAVNIVVVPLIVLVTIGIAVLTSSRGWNPDNFITPIVSVLSDSLTTFAILFVVYIWR
ncbi:magnesium transporter, partial [Candidatus Bathyarchaeota archaeon]|nr:magnesium transporter [Candidatus Bathyarchaeota archaeon]